MHRILPVLILALLAFPTHAQRPPRPHLTVHSNLPYADTENPRQTLDLYLPKQPSSERPLPVIAFIHGGAWRAGNKNSGRGRLAPLLATGDYAGVSIAYRLTGEATWPAQIHDCKAAIRWLRANAKKYNLDPDKIAVWGTSAGGHLVAMLGTSGDVDSLEGDLGAHTEHSSRVSAVVNYFGPSELLTMGDHPSRIDHNAPDSPESKLVGGPLQQNKDAARAASPVTYVTGDDPPFLHVHGTADQLVPFPQSETLHARLKKANVTSTLIPVPDGGHGRFNDPDIDNKVTAFLKTHLLGGRSPDSP